MVKKLWRPRRLATACVVGAIGLASLGAVDASAGVIDFCGGTYGGNGFCNEGSPFYIQYIEAQADHDDFCVYRATAGYPGAPSASGNEYCAASGSGGYVYQSFHGYYGYPATHNRHSFSVYVYYADFGY